MKRPARAKPAAAKPQPRSSRVLEFLVARSLAIAVALLAIGSARIIATYAVFSHTSDEPAHLAAGMEALDKHVYGYEVQHPPLARVMAALGPYLAGLHSQGKPEINEEGVAILSSGDYDRTLTLARLGVLPFFWAAGFAVYFWARRCCGPAAAAIAVFLFTFLPPVLAHAGLATTDMALTAWLGAAFVAMLAWVERPDARRSLLFGACTGLAVLSKLSTLVFFPAAVAFALAGYLWVERPGGARLAALARARLAPLAIAVAAGSLAIWAGYGFSFAKWPAPELFAGIASVVEHNRKGHAAFLLGEFRRTGWWYYYPVVLAVKTPLPYIALALGGAAAAWCARSRTWTGLAFSLGILAVALTSRINIGVRHVLPVYMGGSIMAAFAVVRLLEKSKLWARAALAVLLLWFAGVSALSHPDYLPYFNELAGDRPERIVVDSDLDWGQDMKRLAQRLRTAGTGEVAFTPFAPADLAKLGFPRVTASFPDRPSPGWNAMSLTTLNLTRTGIQQDTPGLQLWADRIPPLERVGKSILLWYFPPGN